MDRQAYYSAGSLCLWLRLAGYVESSRVLWTLAAFILYALVHVEFRHIGGFVVLAWAIAYRMFREGVQEGIWRTVVLVAAVALASSVMAPLPKIVIQTALDVAKSRIVSDQYEIAQQLSTLGLLPGDQIASIGAPFGSHFARLGRLKFVAEVMDEDIELFWRLDEQRKVEVFRSLASTGARAVIATGLPVAERSHWMRLADSDYYECTLDGR